MEKEQYPAIVPAARKSRTTSDDEKAFLSAIEGWGNQTRNITGANGQGASKRTCGNNKTYHVTGNTNTVQYLVDKSTEEYKKELARPTEFKIVDIPDAEYTISTASNIYTDETC
jgi:hypothetical protein